ncbi:uncharacterized protein TEOVI_000544600 [Trypanosoma equiperdum]|uniref:Variant surface glycoprotein (VSG) n=1 Tax=Trypanosoma equiperdum TaxID=5694 RepID=A0A1G4I4V9_TRYEQ|nr:hypothetical protein, conserved [Trypanosoma equiperdum]
MTRHRGRSNATLRKVLCAAALFLIETAQYAQSSATGDDEMNKVTTQCQEATMAAALADKYAAAARTGQDNAAQLSKLSAIWRTKASEQRSPTESAILIALAEIAAQKAAAATESYKRKAEKLQAAAMVYAKRAGYLTGLIQAARLSYATEANMLKADRSNNKMIIRTGKPNGLQGNCDGSHSQLNGVEIKAAAAGSATWKKLMYSSDRETITLFPVLHTKLTLSTSGACTVSADLSGFGPSGSSCGTTWSSATNPRPQTTATTGPKPEAIYKEDNVGGDCAISKVEQDDTDKELHTLLRATCEAQKVYNQAIDSVADLTLDTVLENTAMILAVRNSDERFKSLKGKDVDSAAEKIKTTIKAFLGGSPEKFTQLFITKITDEDVEYRGAEETTKAKRKDLAQKSDSATAITYFLDKKTPKPQPETAKTSSATDKCKADTDENKCTEDEDCEHKGGKCKLKEGVKVENDAKTTNTTGNNYVVTHKASLFMALFTIINS